MDIMTMLDNSYLGNTLQQWIISLLIVLAAIIAGKIIYWIFGNVVKKLTAKTKTKLDDIIVDMIEEPIVFALTLLGIYIGVTLLVLPENVLHWIWLVFQILIVINVAWLVTRLFDSLFEEYLVPMADKSETDLDDQLLPIARKGTKIIVWGMALVVAVNNAGYDITALLAGLGIGGLALAMAAKDTVANIFGGFTIFADKPFKIKDRVKIGGFDGTIKEIGLRSTRLVTLEGRVVTIPNSMFSDQAVENVTWEPSRKVVNNIGLVYDTTPAKMEKAIKILRDIAKKNKNVQEKVLCSFTEFGDSAMNIFFVYYIKKSADILETKTEMNMEILKQFSKAKLDMAFPTRTVYNKKG